MTTLDFTLLETARIPTLHFAKLCGASRVSVFNWARGVSEPRGLYRAMAAKRLDAIRRALERGALPLPHTPRGEKYGALLRVING